MGKPGPTVLYCDTSTTLRDPSIIVVIVFAGFATDADVNCDAIARFQAYSPDGKPWSDPINGGL